jgi:hypothetical protein
MAKRYEPLREFLARQGGNSLRMKFKQIDQIVGGLPPSAWTHRPWWSNSPNWTHARNGWLAAGWKTADVDMQARELTFERVKDSPSTTAAQRAWNPLRRQKGRELDIEALAGGRDNLVEIVLAVKRYVDGEIVETELGRVIRQHWGKG